ncbi:MAG: hypothetical protein M1835_007927 [Candelina submexicana]|nr:MAG: hypothetical protein M1835_007927 [Candelina submexicana]
MSLLTILLRLSIVIASQAGFSTAERVPYGRHKPSNSSEAEYSLEDDYTPSEFFSKFSFFTENDPTHGFVKYVNQSTAQVSGLISISGGSAYIGVDHKTNSSTGRASVRIASTKLYNHGLIIADIAHMPGGICGTWPAFWTLGPDWPNGGEIDILEGVNSQNKNAMTLHTSPGCSITNDGGFTGNMTTTNCNTNVGGNVGCGIASLDTRTYGKGFNANGGGVYATEWTSKAISIWFFSRGSIPRDVSSGAPAPSTWGQPVAKFQGGCDIDKFFKNQQIIFDTTFCGDWAGNTWNSSTCASLAPTCQAYVQNNPSVFKDAYWSVNSLKVYQSPASSEEVSSNSTTSSKGLSAGVLASTAGSGSVNGSSSRAIATASSDASLATFSSHRITVSTASTQARSSTLLHAGAAQTSPAIPASYSASDDESETDGVPPSSARRRHAGHLLSHRKRHGGLHGSG